jgi:hypothetical protein
MVMLRQKYDACVECEGCETSPSRERYALVGEQPSSIKFEAGQEREVNRADRLQDIEELDGVMVMF